MIPMRMRVPVELGPCITKFVVMAMKIQKKQRLDIPIRFLILPIPSQNGMARTAQVVDIHKFDEKTFVYFQPHYLLSQHKG